MQMKLNKPKTTDRQIELENYVVGLLTELPVHNELLSKIEPTSVTNLHEVKEKRASAQEKKKKSSNSKLIEKNYQAEKTADIPPSLKELISEIPPTKEEPYVLNPSSHKVEVGVVLPKETKSKEIQQNKNNSDEIRHNEKINQEIEEYGNRVFQEPEQKDPRLQGVKKLLAKIALANSVETEFIKERPVSDNTSQAKVIEQPQISEDVVLESAEASFAHRESLPLKSSLGSVFQTLVFEVNHLPLAVPLVKLGGIVNVSKHDITPLVGTPDWFMGLIRNDHGNLMVVDTQQFLMPEQKPVEDREYQYLIILDDSKWALACHSVGDAKNLSPDDIRWSSRSSKRPWFAGMVVEYMSALLEVDELINMLAENIVD